MRPDIAGSMEAFDLTIARQGFVAQQVFPIINVAKQAGVIGTIALADLLKNAETTRAPGAGYSRGAGRFTPSSYACVEYGMEEVVDDREATMYADYFDAELVATARCRSAILRQAEIRIAAQVFNATTWTGSALSTAVTNEWDDFTNATPVADVAHAAGHIFSATGFYPNALVVNRDVFKNLCQCDQVVEAIHSFGSGQSAIIRNITPALVAAVLDLDYVFVAGGAKNSALEGQTATPAVIWSGEYAMVCRVATSNDFREACIGRTMHWSEDGSQPLGTVETYRDETVRGNVVRCRFDVDEVTLLAAAGHLLSNITT
jgi:hypothetical protein